MKDIIFDDVTQGMNNRVSPRNLLKVGSDGIHHGPYPLLNNIDRSEGTFKPRGSPYLMNINAEAYHVLPGRVVGLYTTPPITSGDYEAALIDNTENVWVGCRESSIDSIGRLIITTAGVSSWQKITTLTKGTDPISFLQTDERHLLVYNGVQTKVINCFNMCADNMNTALCASATVDPSGVLDVYDVSGDGRWDAISRDLIGGYMSLRYNSVWYGPFAVETVHYHIGLTVDGVLWNPHRYRITFTGGLPAAMYTHNIDTIAGGGVYAYCFGAKLFGCPAPKVAPVAVPLSTAGGLIGSYQYAYTFEGLDGMESNFSPWSNVVSVNSKQVMVSNVTYASRVGETWEAYGTVIRCKIYRRGGMMGDTPMLIDRLTVPWQLETKATGGALYEKVIGYNGAAVGANGTDITLDITHGDPTQYMTSPGTVRFVDHNTTGYSTSAGEIIRYETIDVANGKLQNITRGYHSSGSSTWVTGSCMVGNNVIDNTADDVLTGIIGPENYDHAVPPQDIKFALKTGNKLFVVSKAYPYQVCESAVGGWQYFRGDFAQTIDPNDVYTGGVINIGIDTMPITGMAELEPGAVICFKHDACYSLVGRSMPESVVDIVKDVPGCDSPYTIAVNRFGLIWMNRQNVYWWDGRTPVVDLTAPLTTFKNMTTKIDTATLTWGRTVWGYATVDTYRLHYSLAGDTRVAQRYIEWDWRYPVPLLDKQTTAQVVLPSPTVGDYVPGMHAHVSDRRESDPIIYAGYYITSAPAVYKIATTFGTGLSYGAVDATDAGILQVQVPAVVMGFNQIRLETFLVNVGSPVGAPAATLNLYPINDLVDAAVTQGTINATPALAAIQTLTDRFGTNQAIFCRAPALRVQEAAKDLQTGAVRHSIERIALRLTGGREDVKPRSG